LSIGRGATDAGAGGRGCGEPVVLSAVHSEWRRDRSGDADHGELRVGTVGVT